MKVYALFNGLWDERELWGVFDTLEGAQAEHDRLTSHKPDWQGPEAGSSDRRWGCAVGWSKEKRTFGCSFAIEEHELQVAPALSPGDKILVTGQRNSGLTDGVYRLG